MKYSDIQTISSFHAAKSCVTAQRVLTSRKAVARAQQLDAVLAMRAPAAQIHRHVDGQQEDDVTNRAGNRRGDEPARRAFGVRQQQAERRLGRPSRSDAPSK